VAFGFNVETLLFNRRKLEIWDLGRLPHKPYWPSYYPGTQAIIYVVDSSDRAGLQTANQELTLIL